MVMGQFKEVKIDCDGCSGSGEITPEGNKCLECKGRKVVNQKKVIEVMIDKGSPDGDKYTYHGEADEFPEKEAGDVVFIVS
jgi:DnaJ family protein A protein 2